MRKLLLLCLFFMLVTGACAEEADLAPIYEFAENYDAGEIARDAFEAALDGKGSAWESIWDWMKGRLLVPFRRVGNCALQCVMPAMVLAMLRGCMPEANGGGEAARFMLRLLLLLGFTDIAGLSLDSSRACMQSVSVFSETVSPGIAALLASMGMKGAASLAAPASALVGGIAEGIFEKYGLLLCRFALCTAIAGNLSEAVDLNRFTSILKKAANWGSGLITTIFTGLVALQGNIVEVADNLGVRTAKFAVDSAAPVIGSGVSDAWDGFVSGVMMTKNALGVSGITALLAAGIEPLVTCIAAMIALSLLAAMLELFGERETARAAEQVAGICQMALSLATGSLVIAIVLLGTAMSIGRSFFA